MKHLSRTLRPVWATSALGCLASLALLACQPTAPPQEAPQKPQGSADAGPTPSPSAADAGAPQAPAAPQEAQRAARPPLAHPRKPLTTRPRNEHELPTTSFEQLMGTLQGQLKNSATALERSPKSAGAHLLYADKLLGVAKVYGDLNQIQGAAEVATDGLKLEPNHPGLLLLRAQARFALHQWKDATEDLKHLKRVKPDHPALPGLEAEIAWNQGEVDKAAEAIRELARTQPSFGTVSRLGHLHYHLGQLPAADEAFARAETLYEDSSPVPLAWLNVQRGLLRLHSGRFEEARVFYEEAHRRAPRYPMATEHLAEIEHLLGHHDRALELYLQVVEQTDNPEFHAALAGLYRDMGQEDKAKEHVQAARKRSLELLARHPSAMGSHGADFFLEDGAEPARALELLTRNAAERPNPESLQGLASAQLANGQLEAAAATIDKALATPVRMAEIFWTAARIAVARDRVEEAERYMQQALELNPKIAVLEGDLTAP